MADSRNGGERRSSGVQGGASDGGVFVFSPTTLTAPPQSSSTPAPAAPVGHFQTLPAGASLPSNATCASEVRPAAETRRYPYHQTAFASNDDAAVSTAYNVDYAYANWRNCYDGNDQWLYQFSPPRPYQAGELWGCVGVWYSGRWYDSGAVSYISKVQSYLNQRIWQTPDFLGAA